MFKFCSRERVKTFQAENLLTILIQLGRFLTNYYQPRKTASGKLLIAFLHLIEKGALEMEDKVRLAMVGCGGMAYDGHRRGMVELWKKGIRNFEVVAAVDIDLEKAERMASGIEDFQEKRPKVYEDLDELLKEPESFDAVGISTLHRNHHEMAVPCLELGKHVIIEKPFAFTMKACHKIMDAAKENGCLLQVAENYRFSLGNRAVRWAVSEGMIGKPRMLFWIGVGERLWSWGWRDIKDQAGGGWSFDCGVHFTDLFRFSLGLEAEKIYAISKIYSPFRYKERDKLEGPMVESTVEDTTIAIIAFQNDVTVQWTSTIAAPGEGFSNSTIYGDEGSLNWSTGITLRGGEKIPREKLQADFMASLSEEEKEKLFPHGITDDNVAIEFKQFFDAVQGKGGIEVTGEEGMKDEAICMGLYESAWFGKEIKIADVENCKVEGYQEELNKYIGL